MRWGFADKVFSSSADDQDDQQEIDAKWKLRKRNMNSLRRRRKEEINF